MDALVESDARLRIDKSVFQIGWEFTRERGTSSRRPGGLPRDIKDSKRSLRLFPARSRRCERTHDIKRDTAKMGTLIVETSESE